MQHDAEGRFLHARGPLRFLDSETDFGSAKFVVIGAPLDVTGTFRAGYRDGPTAIRVASSQLETYSFRYSLDADEVPIHDIGDLNVGFDVNQGVKIIEDTVAQVRSSGKIPLLLGGEHTITFGGFLGSGADKLVVFDAHLDLRDEYQGMTISHATWLRRLSEKVHSDRILIVGGRATSSEEIASKPDGLRILRSADLRSLGDELVKWVSDAESCYLSVDMDFFDPAYAPGVGNPEPEGSSPSDFFDLLSLTKKPMVLGADVCEVIPTLDPSGITSILASKVLLELVSLVSSKDLAQGHGSI